MDSKSCPAWLRALRRATRSISQSRAKTTRPFMTTLSYYNHLPVPNATSATSIPPITPQTAPSDLTDAKTPPRIKVVEELVRVTARATETYSVYGVTEKFIKECAKQADYSISQASDPSAEMPKTDEGEDLGVGAGWWHVELGLKPTFSTWSQVTMLHMYTLAVRLRCFAAPLSPMWQQHLLDHFFYGAENKMTIEHNMHARGTRNRYLKDLFLQWRGLLAAYDEGLMKGDTVLAAAVWRNLFKADEEVDVRKVAMVVSYLRRTLRDLEGLPDEVIQAGEVGFDDPGKEDALVSQRSPMMDIPLKDGRP